MISMSIWSSLMLLGLKYRKLDFLTFRLSILAMSQSLTFLSSSLYNHFFQFDSAFVLYKEAGIVCKLNNTENF